MENKFKIGDNVKVITNQGQPDLTIGRIGKIILVGYPQFEYCVKFENNEAGQGVFGFNLERVV